MFLENIASHFLYCANSGKWQNVKQITTLELIL